MAKTYIEVAAPNDRNGNPQRALLTLVKNNVIAVTDCGYSGYPKNTNGAFRINVQVSEYKLWIRYGKSQCDLIPA